MLVHTRISQISGGNNYYDFTENQSTNFRVVLIVKAKIICVMPKGRGGALPSTPPFFLHGHNQTVQH